MNDSLVPPVRLVGDRAGTCQDDRRRDPIDRRQGLDRALVHDRDATISECRVGTATIASVVPGGRIVGEAESPRRDVEAVTEVQAQLDAPRCRAASVSPNGSTWLAIACSKAPSTPPRPPRRMVGVDVRGRIREVVDEDGLDPWRDRARDRAGQVQAADASRHQADTQDRRDLGVIGRQGVEIPAQVRQQAGEVLRDRARPSRVARSGAQSWTRLVSPNLYGSAVP